MKAPEREEVIACTDCMLSALLGALHDVEHEKIHVREALEAKERIHSIIATECKLPMED